MRSLSISEIIALFVFGLIGFLLFAFGVGLMHKAWLSLLVLTENQFGVPESGLFFFLLNNPIGIAILHDLGIFLATLGIIVLFVIYFIWLLPLGTPPRQKRGFQYIFGFLSVFAAWIGIWIFMHRAFLIQLEYWRGFLPTPTLPIGFLQLAPSTLHLIGLILVGFFFVGAFLVLLYKAYQVIQASHTATGASSLPISTSATAVPAPVDWPLSFLQIQEDWKFYFIAFIPYFSAAFAVWILLFEGFIAKLFGIPLIWALIPWVQWTPNTYFLIGTGLLLTSMIAIWAVIVFVRRAPWTQASLSSWWWQGSRRCLFAILTSLVIFSLGVGLLLLSVTFWYLESLLLSTALLWQQIGDGLIIIGLLTAFIIIVGERTSES